MKGLLVILLAVGCSRSSTGLQNTGPSVRIVNESEATITFTWWPSSGAALGNDVVPPQATSFCERYRTHPDPTYVGGGSFTIFAATAKSSASWGAPWIANVGGNVDSTWIVTITESPGQPQTLAIGPVTPAPGC